MLPVIKCEYSWIFPTQTHISLGNHTNLTFWAWYIFAAVNYEESDKGSLGNDDNSCSAFDINEDSNLSMNDANNDDNEVDNSYVSNEDDENEDNEIDEEENDDDNDDDGGNGDTQNTYEGDESNLVPSIVR